MALAITNDKGRGRFIFYKVNGVTKKEWFKAYETRIIQEIDSIEAVQSRESAAKRRAVENAGPKRAAQINLRGGFVKDDTELDRFEVEVIDIRKERRILTIFNIANNRLTLYNNQRDKAAFPGTEYFNTTNRRPQAVTGLYATNQGQVVELNKGIVEKGFDLSSVGQSKSRIAREFQRLFNHVNITALSGQDILGAVQLMSATGSTGSTGTTTVVTGETGSTTLTGNTTGITSGITTGVTTGTTTGVTGYSGDTCFTVTDLMRFLSCYGASTSGSSVCSIYDFNGNGFIDSGDLLTFISNWCWSGSTS